MAQCRNRQLRWEKREGGTFTAVLIMQIRCAMYSFIGAAECAREASSIAR